jgi:hypothetical protein
MLKDRKNGFNKEIKTTIGLRIETAEERGGQFQNLLASISLRTFSPAIK